MATENQSLASSLNEIKDGIADTELNTVSGGDKTTPTKPTSTKKPQQEFLKVTLNEVLITSVT